MVDRCNNKCNLPLFFLSDFSKSHHLFRPEAGTELNGISTDPMSLFWFPFPFPAIKEEETNEMKKKLLISHSLSKKYPLIIVKFLFPFPTIKIKLL